MFVDGPNDRGRSVVVEQVERLAKPEGGLQRSRINGKATFACVRPPRDGPEAREVVAMSAPVPRTPFPKIEVPERVIDARRLPIQDSREVAVHREQLVLVDVAVDEDMPMSSADVKKLGPPHEPLTMAKAAG